MKRSNRIRRIALSCVLASTLVDVAAAAALPRLHIKIEQARLANGLRVITVEDHTAPVITVALAYDVGAANEQRGRTGFAHLFEHLMFQGSEHVKPGEHLSVITDYGGIVNATTGVDWTFYFESVPANQLDLALFLEADRLRSLDISPANLAREIEVVKEERRMRLDNQPYGRNRQLLEGQIYDSWAYSHDGVGSMEDLAAATVADVRSFFDTYYRPSNAALVLIGDFQTPAVIAKVKQYFDALPERPKPAQADRTEPPQTAERRQTVNDPLAPLPELRIAFKAVPGDHPDYYALEVLSAVLQAGQSSRLNEALVQREELLTQVSGSIGERRAAGALYLTSIVRSTELVAAAEQGIYREIERLQREPVADWELDKAKNLVASAFLSRFDESVMRAVYIGSYTVDFNNPERINDYLDHISAVTKQDLQRVARTHLRAANRTVLITLPATTAEKKQ